METVKVGFIGAGSLANAMHYPSLAEFEDVQIVAICDLDENRLNSTADRYEVEGRYTDYRRMLDSEELDAVYVIMPPHHLYDIVVRVLESKHNVFIEKPPGVTSFQTRSLARLAEKNGCKTMCAFNRRFIPLNRKVREIVEERGPIIQCTSTFYKNSSAIYYKGAIDILTCDAIHAVDMLRWMGGEVKEVRSLVSQFNSEVPNSFNALVRFEGGGVGFLCTNWAVGKRVHTFEMHSYGISAFIDPDDRALIFADNNEEPTVITAVEAAGSSERHKSYGFYQENRHFIDCIKEDREPETCFADAARSMELVDRIKGGV
jgi:predicted dehydrogenase